MSFSEKPCELSELLATAYSAGLSGFLSPTVQLLMAAPSSGSWNGRAAYLLVEIFSPCKRRLLPPLLFFMVLCCVYAPVSPSLTPRLDTAAIDAVKAGRGLFLEDDSGILCALSDAQLVNSSGQASRKGGWA